VPKYKRPQRRATQHKKYQMVLSPHRELPDRDPLLVREVRAVSRVQGYAQDGKPRPRGYTRMEIDPRLADVWFRRAGIPAIAILLRACEVGMAPEATERDRMNGVRAAMELQNRLYGKPVEKLAVAGRVKIEFGGLNPNAFPQTEPEAGASEIVELVGTEGTEVPGDPVEVIDNGVQAPRVTTDPEGEEILNALCPPKRPKREKAPDRGGR
jgi:hypothetical protein